MNMYETIIVYISILALVILSAANHNKIKILEMKVIASNADIEMANADINKLRKDLDSFKTQAGFIHESNWKSLANMRNNFKAFGHGFHLEDKDFAPEDENDTNGTSNSSDGKVQ